MGIKFQCCKMVNSSNLLHNIVPIDNTTILHTSKSVKRVDVKCSFHNDKIIPCLTKEGRNSLML